MCEITSDIHKSVI